MSYDNARYYKVCQYCKGAKEIPSWQFCDRKWCRDMRTPKVKTFLMKLREKNKKTN